MKIKFTLFQATLTYWVLAYDAVQFEKLNRKVLSQHTLQNHP